MMGWEEVRGVVRGVVRGLYDQFRLEYIKMKICWIKLELNLIHFTSV